MPRCSIQTATNPEPSANKTTKTARKKIVLKPKDTRRRYTDEFREEAVQMLLDGHTAPSMMTRLGLSNISLHYRWKQERLTQSGPVASSL